MIAVHRNDLSRSIVAGHVPMNRSKAVVFTATRFLPHLQGYWEASKQSSGLWFGNSGELHDEQGIRK